MGARSGLIADVQSRARAALPPEMFSQFESTINSLRRDAQTAVMELEAFFTTLHYFLQEQGHIRARSQYTQQIRLVRAVRSQPGYDEVEISWGNLDKFYDSLASISRSWPTG